MTKRLEYDPEETRVLRRQVAELMADGRWRTATDVALRVGAPVAKVRWSLMDLGRMELLQCEKPRQRGPMQWRKAR